ncbi:MAG TPA: hypothetical protein VF515_20260 [Candidatus Binatia bacterium]
MSSDKVPSRTLARVSLNRTAIHSLLLALLWQPIAACAGASPFECSDGLLQKLPSRASTAPTGSEFAHRVEALSGADREQAIEAELLDGDMPQFLRRVVPITMNGELPNGQSVEVTVCTLTDYLAIGSDRDFLIVPMSLATALTVAGRFGFTLPTSKMVDAIYRQAEVHLAPQPLPASDQMRSTDYYRHHNELIAEQRMALGVLPGVLTAGHKKDLVITNRLWRYPDRVAIYGWHRGINSPIQPLSTVHGVRYADYSHGTRLVSTTIFMDGRPMSIFEALADPGLSQVLSREGPLPRLSDLISRLAPPGVDLLSAHSTARLPSQSALDDVTNMMH